MASESEIVAVDLENVIAEFAEVDAAATASTVKSMADIHKRTSTPGMEMYGDPASMIAVVMLGFHRNDDRLLLEGLRGLSEAVQTATLMLSVFEAVDATRLRGLAKKKHGYVYYAQSDNGLIKIGTSIDPVRRLLGLRSQSSENGLTLLAVSDGGKKEEKRLHAMFSAERCHGEWFEPSPGLLKHISSVKAANKDTEKRMHAEHDSRCTRIRRTPWSSPRGPCSGWLRC